MTTIKEVTFICYALLLLIDIELFCIIVSYEGGLESVFICFDWRLVIIL